MTAVLAILALSAIFLGSLAWLWHGIASAVPATITVIGFCKNIFVVCLAYRDILNLALLWGGVALLSAGILYGISRAAAGIIKARLAIRRLPVKEIGSIALIDDEGSYCAFTHGIFAPRIYLSKGLVKNLEGAELRCVFLHELHHKKMLDPLKFFIVELLADAFFYMPLAKHAAARLRLRKENEADDAAASGTNDPVSLASALVKAARYGAAPGFSTPSFAGGPGMHGTIERRIRRLIGKKEAHTAPVRASSVFVSAVAAAFMMISLALPLKAAPVSAACTAGHCSLHADRLGAECRTHCSPAGHSHVHH